MGISMTKKDLIELYQLASLYKRTYSSGDTGAVSDLMNEVADIYHEMTGNDIQTAHNPRLAGRRQKYDNSMDDKIRLLRSEGLTYRQIAEETGVSYGYVEKVLKSI